MTRSKKLILSFFAVILLMAVGTVGYVFYSQTSEAQSLAAHKVSSALSRLNSDFSRIQASNRDFANKLSRDPAVSDAFSAQDREHLASVLKNATDARGFAGFITVIDQYGKVIFSTDTPSKFGYNLRGKVAGVDYVLNNIDAFTGITAGLSPAQSIALTAMVPVLNSLGKCVAVIAVSDPIDEQFLTGESMKFALLREPLTDIDFVLLNLKDRDRIYVTPGLVQERPDFLRQLSEQGTKALPSANFIKDKRYWQQFSLNAIATRSLSLRSFTPEAAGNNMEVVGIIIASTAIRPSGVQPGAVIIASSVLGLIAFILACFLVSKFAGQSDSSVQILIERLKSLRAGSLVQPAKELFGSWRELSDLIDQALLDWQGKANALKTQLSKLNEQMSHKAQEVQTSEEQFASFNRQLANQNRQLSEFSRQLNYANQQAVFLQHELQAILQSSTEGFLILDQYGNAISANAIFLNWLGMSEAEVAGRFCFDLIKKPGEESNGSSTDKGRAFVKHEADPAALINQFFPEGVIHNAQTGEKVEIFLHLQPVAAHDTNIHGYVLVARDKSLRSEITGLRTEIVNMLAQAVRGPLLSAEKEWQNIISTAEAAGGPNVQAVPTGIQPSEQANLTGTGHELHQQLNRELNQELAPTTLSLAQRLGGLRAQYQGLIKSVETLLNTHGGSLDTTPAIPSEPGVSYFDLEKVGVPGEAARESFSISRLVGDCLEEASVLARERQLLLDHKTSTAIPSLTGDRELMKGILTPVVEKMISITAPGGRVRVESSIKSIAKGKELQLSVFSSGPALSEDELADMFAGFIPEKHSEDSYGTRLALYLARNNAERVGANIWAQSEAGRGTIVYITLPVG